MIGFMSALKPAAGIVKGGPAPNKMRTGLVGQAKRPQATAAPATRPLGRAVGGVMGGRRY